MGTIKIAVTRFLIDCPKPINIPVVKEVMSYNRRILTLLLQIKPRQLHCNTVFVFIEKFEILLLRVWNHLFFHLMNNVLKKMTSCLKAVRKSNFTCNSFLIYPVVSLIHVMKCTVLQVAVRPTT